MTVLNLLYYPDERLHSESTEVTEFDEKLQTLVSDMFETMYVSDGIGLAAPQIGVFKRLVVINLEGRDHPEDQLVLVNPKIIASEGSTGIDEGCLSVPELRAHIDRYAKITVQAQNVHGKHFEITATDLLAICMQHEIDHLNGKLFIDYLSPMKRNMYRIKAVKLAKQRKKDAEKTAHEQHTHA